MNDVTSQIAEQGTAYQDSQTNQYRQTSNQLAGAKIGMEQQKGQNAANLVSNAGNLLGTAATLGVGGNTTGVIPSGTNAILLPVIQMGKKFLEFDFPIWRKIHFLIKISGYERLSIQ